MKIKSTSFLATFFVKKNNLANIEYVTQKKRKTKKTNGFSLLEMMLVLGVATSLMLLAFFLNKSRVSNLQADDAARQVILIEKSIGRLKNTSLNYQFLGSTGLVPAVMSAVIPKQLVDAEGKLSHALGEIDVRAVQMSNPYDAYAITLNGASADFCAKVIAKAYDSFAQVRVGSSLESTEVVWLKSEPFSAARVAEGCAKLTGDRVVQFISAPQMKYGQSVSTSDTASNPIVQIQFIKPSSITAGAITDPTTIGVPAPNTTTPGGFSEIASGYGETVVDQSVQPPPTSDKSCSQTALTWTSQLLDGTSHTCNGNSVLSSDGTHIFVQNTASGKLGGAHYACDSGTWKLTTGTCAPVGCAAKAVSWGGGCSGAAGNSKSQETQNILNQNAAYIGQAQFVCNEGNFTFVSGTCAAVPQPPVPPKLYVTQQYKDGKVRYFEFMTLMGGTYSESEANSAVDSCNKGKFGRIGLGGCKLEANGPSNSVIAYTEKGTFEITSSGTGRLFGDGSGTPFSLDKYKDAAKTQPYAYEYFCSGLNNQGSDNFEAYTILECTKEEVEPVALCSAERVYWSPNADGTFNCSGMAQSDNSTIMNDVAGYSGTAVIKCNAQTKKFNPFPTTCIKNGDGPLPEGEGLVVNGVCGSANNQASSVAPSANLCTKGSVLHTGGVKPTASGWEWVCGGSGVGAVNAVCSAYKSTQNGICGSSSGKTITNTPAENTLCNAGTDKYFENQFGIYVSTLRQNATGWEWTCNGIAGGANATCSAIKGAEPPPPPQKPVTVVQVESRKGYGGINSSVSIFNMYAPSDWEVKSYPVMITIHGGGWMEGGGNLGDFDLWARHFAQKGYKVFDISYTVGSATKPAYQLPAAMSDVETFLQYIKNNSKYRISPTDSISITGGSAGGHLAMYNAAYGSTRFKCVVNVAGPVDITGTFAAADRYPTDKTGIPDGFLDGLVRSIRDNAAPTLAQQNQANINPAAIKAQRVYQVYSERDNIVINSINMEKVNSVLGSRVSNSVVPYRSPYIDGGHNLGTVEGMIVEFEKLGIANSCK